MDLALARSITRIGRELVAALSQQAGAGTITGKHGTLSGYSAEYVLGLGVALGILWESVNRQPLGKAHTLELKDLLGWVRDVQKLAEPKGELIQ